MSPLIRPPATRFPTRLVLLVVLGPVLARADEPSGRQAPPSTAAQRERLKERDRLGEQAQKLQAAGKLDQAIKAADAKLSIEREVLGTDSDDAIVSLSFLARLHLAREDWPVARSARRESLDRLAVRLGKDHWRVTHARQALADIDVLAGIGAEQRRRLAMAGRLHSEAFELRKKGKNREATAPARQALAIRREVLGERHSDTILSLDNLGYLLLAQGDLKAARPLFEHALVLNREVLGERHPSYIASLNNLAYLLETQGDLKSARPMYERALSLSRKALGERHNLTITSLNNLACLLVAQGDVVAARPICERALSLCREVKGERHPDTITNLNNLAYLLKSQGDLKSARPLYERALQLSREALGERHPDTIASLNNLAALFRAQGDFRAARPMYERALQLNREALGERHHLTITSLNNLAALILAQGEVKAARPIFERALELSREALGERHPESIQSLNNLAASLEAQGDYLAARPMYERALRLRREALGERHPDTIASLNNLASLLRAQGNLKAARPLFERALELRREILGEHHPSTILSLNNLAYLVQFQGDVGAAQPLCERALELSREVLGERHPETITNLNNLAYLLQARGDLKAARPMYERALELGSEVLGERHPDSVISLNNLACLFQDQGDLKAARPFFERALEFRREALGDRHPDTIQSLNNLACLLLAQGDIAAARQLAGRALEAAERRVGETLLALTEREQVAYLGAARETCDFNLGLAAGEAGSDSGAYRHVLAWKGLAAQFAAARAAAQSSGARDLLADLALLRARLNAMHFARVPSDKADERARATLALADEVARKESELARAVGWKPEPPAPAAIAATLPPGAAFVDFLRYRHWARSERGRDGLHAELRYVAYVVRMGEPPKRVELGPAAPIEEALAAWRARLQGGDDAEEMGRTLAGLVWAPLEKHLGKARTVLVSPDWQLSFLPWAALPGDEPGSLLIRRYTFGTLVSARQLIDLAKTGSPPAGGGLLAAGGVNYGKADAVPADVAFATRSAAVDRGSLTFGPLPGTAVEAREVAELYRKVSLGGVEGLSGSSASKERLLSAMAGRRHLHLATHGFFTPPDVRSMLAPDDAPTGLKSWEGMSRDEIRGFYPGLLSGLVWAGAANPPKDRHSGADDLGACLMTAEEVASIDLKGCELAVLSACETGLGAAAGGEGVKGLQSAFHSAGCRTVVASLWRVDDAATRALMTRFYASLWQKKQPAIAALREAQLSILDDPEYGDGGNPRLWAAWVLSGDPGVPIPAERTQKVGR